MLSRRALLSGLIALPAASQAAAQGCIPPLPGLPCPKEAWEMVELEHADRVRRLMRLSGHGVQLEFTTDVVTPEEHGLTDFPASIPVLRVVANESAFFATARSDIRREAFALIDVIADNLLHEPPDVVLFVAGHTDDRGSDSYNYDLGLRRAESVAAALVRRGIYQAEVYRISFGETVAMMDNSTSLGRAHNRRVEFLFAARIEAIVSVLENQDVPGCASHVGSTIDRCDQSLSFEAGRVEVAPDATQEVLELGQELKELDSNPALTPIESGTERTRIEAERDRIPIIVARKRVAIELGR